MAKFLLVYHGGGAGMEVSPEEGAKIMQAWTEWFASLGSAVVDAGNPISRSWTLSSDGTADDGGANPSTGYSVLQAESMQAASEMAIRCPHIAAGGTVELCETFDVMASSAAPQSHGAPEQMEEHQ